MSAEVQVTEQIANSIRMARSRRHWSARQLAEACQHLGSEDISLSRGTIAKIESGLRKAVTLDEIAVLAQALGVTPGDLLDSEPNLTVGEADRIRHEWPRLLSRAHQVALDQPILPVSDASPSYEVPTLRQIYVTPEFRALTVTRQITQYIDESRWAGQPRRSDLDIFLSGYLTSPSSAQQPLLITGAPGSGKSALTKILAAQLPPDHFLVVRVVLRNSDANSGIQDQIEAAVRLSTGESVAWPDLIRSAGDVLPVIVLDGLDELMRVTGTSHSDYLERIGNFQQRESAIGRPVAVIVTSRDVALDRMRTLPGMLVIRLEPFSEDQTARFLQTWNQSNAGAYAQRGLTPLTLEAVHARAELAEQPLLLTMLALYGADGTQLQRPASAGSTAELYESLIISFVKREVRKRLPSSQFGDRELQDEVEREMVRLSVVAIAMFCRNRQWVSDPEIDQDLALLAPRTIQDDGLGSWSRLSPGQVTVGEFFFVHASEGPLDEARSQTEARSHNYEFLHATFGEYLIARIIYRTLSDLVDITAVGATRSQHQDIDDAFLWALLSYATLALRATVISFIGQLLQALPGQRRQRLRELLARLFARSLTWRFGDQYTSYEPVHLPAPTRYATYSVNLVLLAALTAGELRSSELFPQAHDPVSEWRKLALLWRSQLSSDEWSCLLDTVSIERIRNADDNDDVVLQLKTEESLADRRTLLASAPKETLDPATTTFLGGIP